MQTYFSFFLRISTNLLSFILKASFIMIEDTQSAEIWAGTLFADID